MMKKGIISKVLLILNFFRILMTMTAMVNDNKG